uniref:Uncharacterized protein n=1 Tax=Anopheles albimanus TaxID=7167 RepID=A0A182FTK2_ANOAL
MASSEHPAPAPPPPPAAPGLPPPPPAPMAPGGLPAKKPQPKVMNFGGVPPEDANDRLLADIRAGVSLKPTKTKDRSSAVIRRRANFR